MSLKNKTSKKEMVLIYLELYYPKSVLNCIMHKRNIVRFYDKDNNLRLLPLDIMINKVKELI